MSRKSAADVELHLLAFKTGNGVFQVKWCNLSKRRQSEYTSVLRTCTVVFLHFCHCPSKKEYLYIQQTACMCIGNSHLGLEKSLHSALAKPHNLLKARTCWTFFKSVTYSSENNPKRTCSTHSLCSGASPLLLWWCLLIITSVRCFR